MSDNQVSDVLAQAFAAEGVDTLFTLMGDANMYWSASMADNQKVRLIHARHEHCCVAMADAWARATGEVGVASVTCGPGYTQIMTALVMAARGNAPVVVFAGDAPIGASWYLQSIDQAPLALATGAHFVPIRTIDRALDCVREAFYVARAERKPVVLSVPLDLQKEEFPYLPDYMPSTDLMPRRQVLRPDPEIVDEIAAMVAEAERPIIIGGRGATWSGAKGALEVVGRGVGRLAGDDFARQGPVRWQPVCARYRRHLRHRSGPRILRRERSGDCRRSRPRPLHDRGRISVSECQGRPHRHPAARAVARA